MSASNPTLITFVIYIAAMVLIGFMAYRSTNNLSDYIPVSYTHLTLPTILRV